jgi:hypothetical protein
LRLENGEKKDDKRGVYVPLVFAVEDDVERDELDVENDEEEVNQLASSDTCEFDESVLCLVPICANSGSLFFFKKKIFKHSAQPALPSK